jgi:alpha-L-rhamnosidase
MVGDIQFANASFNTPYGLVKCDWEKQKKFTVISIEIPANSSAIVYLPEIESSKIFEGGSPLEKISDVQVLKKENGKLICRIGSGKYFFRINN